MNPSVLPRYRNTSLGTRFFLKARWHLTPYAAMAAKLPERGRCLDLGCGHGLLAMTLALQSAEREVLAIDHDRERIGLAARAAKDLPNLSFQAGNLVDPPMGGFAGITLIDVMHYFDPETQEQLLAGVVSRLEPGGILLVREVDPQGGMASSWNKVYEKLATASGFTRAEKKGLHFRSRAGWSELLERHGLEVRSERCSSILFADILYIGRK